MSAISSCCSLRGKHTLPVRSGGAAPGPQPRSRPQLTSSPPSRGPAWPPPRPLCGRLRWARRRGRRSARPWRLPGALGDAPASGSRCPAVHGRWPRLPLPGGAARGSAPSLSPARGAGPGPPLRLSRCRAAVRALRSGTAVQGSLRRCGPVPIPVRCRTLSATTAPSRPVPPRARAPFECFQRASPPPISSQLRSSRPIAARRRCGCHGNCRSAADWLPGGAAERWRLAIDPARRSRGSRRALKGPDTPPAPGGGGDECEAALLGAWGGPSGLGGTLGRRRVPPAAKRLHVLLHLLRHPRRRDERLQLLQPQVDGVPGERRSETETPAPTTDPQPAPNPNPQHPPQIPNQHQTPAPTTEPCVHHGPPASTKAQPPVPTMDPCTHYRPPASTEPWHPTMDLRYQLPNQHLALGTESPNRH